jgi:hypothetical protein
MSYTNLIDINLNRAFNLLKDLAINAVLQKVNTTSFDFGTAVASVAPTNINVKIIVVEDSRDHKETSATTRQVLMKAKGIGQLNTTDRLIFNGQTWKLSHVLKSDGYIVQAEIVREV